MLKRKTWTSSRSFNRHHRATCRSSLLTTRRQKLPPPFLKHEAAPFQDLSLPLTSKTRQRNTLGFPKGAISLTLSLSLSWQNIPQYMPILVDPCKNAKQRRQHRGGKEAYTPTFPYLKHCRIVDGWYSEDDASEVLPTSTYSSPSSQQTTTKGLPAFPEIPTDIFTV